MVKWMMLKVYVGLLILAIHKLQVEDVWLVKS